MAKPVLFHRAVESGAALAGGNRQRVVLGAELLQHVNDTVEQPFRHIAVIQKILPVGIGYRGNVNGFEFRVQALQGLVQSQADHAACPRLIEIDAANSAAGILEAGDDALDGIDQGTVPVEHQQFESFMLHGAILSSN